MNDWIATLGAWFTGALGVVGAAVSYGMMRQKVADLRERADEQDERLDKLTTALEKATSLGASVDLLRQSTGSQHELLLNKLEAGQTLTQERLDGVRSEVRAFMQGQAAGRRGQPQ